MRKKVWLRLATDWKPAAMDTIVSRTVGFDDMPDLFQDFVDGKITGRTVLEINPEWMLQTSIHSQSQIVSDNDPLVDRRRVFRIGK